MRMHVCTIYVVYITILKSKNLFALPKQDLETKPGFQDTQGGQWL